MANRSRMFDFIKSNFRNGLRVIRENSQLAYTLFVGVFIVFAFLFVANNFISIARDAQEKLIDVRIGSIQDVFSKFAYEYFDDPVELGEKIKSVKAGNATILEFDVISLREEEAKIIASLDEERIGEAQDRHFLNDLAVASPHQSLTVEESLGRERFFRTARAVLDDEGQVVGLLNTRQTLSRADQMIGESIRLSIIILVSMVFVVMVLFLRHARIIDYATLYRRIDQINKMKDEFISMASHELRSPLTIIRGYASVLKDAELDKEQEEFVDYINSQAKRLSTIIEDISFTSLIEQGRIRLEMELFDPEKMIKRSVESWRKIARQKGLDLVLEIKGSGQIRADENRLEQVLANIIGNAIKYTNKGKVKVEVSTGQGNLVIKVMDTGIGMTAEQQKNLFKKFYRVKSEETGKISGTGLGLWIVKRLLELMKGSISLESIKGRGTHVSIFLPLAEGD